MKKFLQSKIFVFVCTFISFLLGGIAGWLLAYQPIVNGKVSGSSGIGGSTSGITSTSYAFQIKAALGYWMIALIMTFAIFLLCVLIRKLYISHDISVENTKNKDN